MNSEKIFDSIEKVFRYLVPAFILVLLISFYENEFYIKHIKNLDNTKFVFYFSLAGMTVYSIHRLIFEIVDLVIYKYLATDKISISEAIATSLDIPKDKLNYFYYKQATIHSVLISIELWFVFLICNGVKKNLCYLILAALTYTVSFIIYVAYYKVQVDFVQTFPQDLNNKGIERSTNSSNP